jgi:DNA-directed RNA polymerase specialized sigma24 family protein
MSKETRIDYINNKMLYDEIVKWRESGKEKLTDSLGRAIMLLAKKILNHRNFSRYNDIIKEEMYTESIISMIKAVPKFDCEKYSNPFAYLTSCAWNANIGVIGKFYSQQAAEIGYFLANTEEIDTTDGQTLTIIDQYNAFKDSQERKKVKYKEKQKEKSTKPKLF